MKTVKPTITQMRKRPSLWALKKSSHKDSDYWMHIKYPSGLTEKFYPWINEWEETACKFEFEEYLAEGYLFLGWL